MVDYTHGDIKVDFRDGVNFANEAKEVEYMDDILSDMQVLSGTVYDENKVPPND